MKTFLCSVPGSEQEEVEANDFDEAAEEYAESENDYSENSVLKQGSIDVDVESEDGEIKHFNVIAEAQVHFYAIETKK